MEEHLEIDPHFTGFSESENHTFDNDSFLSDSFDLSSLIEQSIAPLSVNNILTTMNHNIIQTQNEPPPQPVSQQTFQLPQAQQVNLTTLNQLSMYQLLSAGNMQNMNINGMPVIIVNLPQHMQHAVVSPATPTAEVSHNMAQMTMKEPIAGHQSLKRSAYEEEPPHKKRRPSVVDESASDQDLMALSQQMDLLRRNSLPVLHTIHMPRQRPGIQPSISVDELISPSKFVPREDIDLLCDYGQSGHDDNDDSGEVEFLGDDYDEAQTESPPSQNANPFDFGNFFTSAPPAKTESKFAATLQPLQIPTNNVSVNHIHSAPTPTEQPRKQRRRKSSTPGGDTPGNTPGTPSTTGADGRKLVCLGKRPRKNKKTQPEDQFLMKFTMRRNK
jgi:hypothetical protein